MERGIKTALVVEGGGMRGVFAAGVLDCFLEKNFDPFGVYFGVSAGACNLSSHLGRQHGRNYRCFTDYMLKPDFFSFRKYLRGGHFMDLDWFWEYLARVEPLNAAAASKREFYVVVTNVRTGMPEYLRARERTLLDVLKASSALPLMYRRRIGVNGAEYMDGGVVDAIPVREAYRRGAGRIMVVRSQPAGYIKKSFVESKCVPLLFRREAAMRRALRERAAGYNATVDFIQNPPAGTEIVEICPETLHSGRTTRDRGRLERDYAEGRRMGLLAVEKWEKRETARMRQGGRKR